MDVGGEIPLLTVDCREAIQWFVSNFGLYHGSVRGLFLSDFSEEYEPSLEAAIINLKARGINPLVVTGEMLAKQAEYLWEQASTKSSLGRPLASKLELDLWGSDLVIVKDMVAPENHKQLWYLYHHLIYPRLLNGRGIIIASHLGYEEFVRYGAACPDQDFGGRSITWEKLFWLIEAGMINMELFKLMREEGLPPMLKAEYYLWMSLKERGLNAVAQHVLGDYMLDLALMERKHRLNIEIDSIATISGYERQSSEADRNRILFRDGWQTLRFSSAEVLNNHTVCAEIVQEVWDTGWTQKPFGRLITAQTSVQGPELPEDDDIQRSAIIHGGGPIAITGGAGTGKTATLIKRVANLVAQGVSPEAILVLSHSSETIEAIKNAFAGQVDKQILPRLNLYCFQELGFKILKENLSVIKRKAPLKVETNPQKVIQRLLIKYKKDLDQLTLEMTSELDEFAVAAVISRYKANLVSPKEVKSKAKDQVEELIAKAYHAYEEQLQRANRVDPDDRTTLAVQIMLERPEIRARYQQHYEFVFVDEYQDATLAEDILVRLLALPQDNLCLVGDVDEAICEGKGAVPKLLNDISFRMPQIRCYTLDKNWRSHPTIVEHASALAAGLNGHSAQRDMVAAVEMSEVSAIVGPKQLDSEKAEAEWIAEEVQLLSDGGRQLRDIAVLYRYHRYGAILEESLARRGLRCVASHPDAGLVPDEIEDMICFLKLVVDPDGPKAKESFERVCQLRTKEVDPKLSTAIAGFAEANNLSYLKAVEIYSDATADQSCRELQQLVRIIRTMHQEKLPPSDAISLLRRTQRLNDYYRAVHIPPGVTYEPLKRLTQLEEDAKKFSTIQELIKNRESLKQQLAASGGEAGVHVLTLHEAKGLEFPVVFMVGLAEGLFPSENASDLEEERRLCYVGFTRAKELLYVTYPSMFNDVALEPSSFLFESKLLAAPAPEVVPEVVVPPAPAPTPAPTKPKAPLPSFAQPAQMPNRPAADVAAAAARAPLPSFAQPAQMPVRPAADVAAAAAKAPLPSFAQPAQSPVRPAAQVPPAQTVPTSPLPIPAQPVATPAQPAAAAQPPVAPPTTPAPVKAPAQPAQPPAQPRSIPPVAQPMPQPATPLTLPVQPIPTPARPAAVQAAPVASPSVEPAQRLLKPPAQPVQPPAQPRMTPPVAPPASRSVKPAAPPAVSKPAVQQPPATPQPPAVSYPPVSPAVAAQISMPSPVPARSIPPVQPPSQPTQRGPVTQQLPIDPGSAQPAPAPLATGHGQPVNVPGSAPIAHPQAAAVPAVPVSALTPAAGPQCPNCLGSLEAGARFCGACGYHLAARIPSCPLCASPLEPSAKFCGECGTRVTPTAANQPPPSQADPGHHRGPNQHGWLVKMLKTLEQ